MNRKKLIFYLLLLLILPFFLYIFIMPTDETAHSGEVYQENINIIGDEGKRSEIYYDHYYGSGPLMLIRLDKESRISIEKENGEGKVIVKNTKGEFFEIKEDWTGFSEDHYELRFEGRNFSGRILVER